MRKQLFVTAYCVFLYFHFLINVAAAAFLTWKIDDVTSTDTRAACDAIKNAGTSAQCKDLLGGTKGVILFIFWAVIAIELCKLTFLPFSPHMRPERSSHICHRRPPHRHPLHPPAAQ